MKKLIATIQKHFYPLLLLGIVGLLYFTNYKSGTSLLGWDNFNSELSPFLAVRQALSAGWSGFRSFGLVSGMGYATDLWHALFVWAASLLLPVNTIRYVFHVATLGFGALGAFFLFCRLNIPRRYSALGALYYMVNFGTIQIFSLPYEPFSIFFGFFPWALLSWFEVINRFDRKTLLQFLIINLLLSGAFYVQTMFLVYAVLLGSINLIYLLTHRKHWKTILVHSIGLWTMIGMVNAYWILTQIYFLKDAVHVVQDAKQTLLGLHIPLYQNAAHSTLLDFFMNKGLYADFEGNGGLIFDHWLSFFALGPIRLVELALVGCMVVGFFDGKNVYKRFFIALFFVHAVALLMTIPGIRELNGFLRQISVVDQVFRSPFSKFAMSSSLVLAYFFAIGAQALTRSVRQKWNTIAVISLTILILTTSIPAFQGYFFSPEMKIHLPQAYTDLFNFFKTQDKHKRIALLPEDTTWGWYIYKWGYLGSGFLWDGIEQPIVSRSYDVWSRTSENYFWEISTAIGRKDSDAIITVLRKYAVSYLILDTSIVTPPKSTFALDALKTLLEKRNDVHTVFHKDSITVYAIDSPTATSLFVSTNTLPNIGNRANAISDDMAFQTFGTYQTNDSLPYEAYYPFLDFQTFTYDPKRQWKIREADTYFELETTYPPAVLRTGTLSVGPTETFFVKTEKGYEEVSLPVSISTHSDSMTVRFPKVRISPQNFSDVLDCTVHPQNAFLGHVNSSKTVKGLTIETTEGRTACWGYHYDDALQKQAYLLKITSQNIAGLPLSMRVSDHTFDQTIQEQQLSDKAGAYFMLPAGLPDGIGFSVDFQSFSFQQTNSKNRLLEPEAYLFPQASVQSISMKRIPIPESGPASLQTIPIQHQTGSWLYSVSGNEVKNNLVFFQTFDPGWQAWVIHINNPIRPIIQLTNHVFINNWANGWVLPKAGTSNNQLTIVIFFWPQLLEFVGFALLPLPFLWAFFKE